MVSEESFARAQELLQKNKIRSRRRTLGGDAKGKVQVGDPRGRKYRSTDRGALLRSSEETG